MVGVYPTQAIEEIRSGDASGETKARTVFEMAVSGEEDATIEIPNGALGNFWRFFLLGGLGLVDAVFDA